MVQRSKNPRGYLNPVCCDKCQRENLPKKCSVFFSPCARPGPSGPRLGAPKGLATSFTAASANLTSARSALQSGSTR
ncbi:unnamed protein product [Prorocentrum cordatum]|uniref:Uncharacterized protein n=1 Tax=Prorocentrum cordatum TaxID=2364126 RepID=A0ABN9Y674_9DINO|nr:unnamed protein product [Polarella glacialis]